MHFFFSFAFVIILRCPSLLPFFFSPRSLVACFFYSFVLLIFAELYAEELRSGIYPIFPSHSLLVLPSGSWGSACFLL